MASGDRLSVSDGGQTSPSSPAPTTNRRAIAVRHSLTRRCRVRSCPPAEWHRRLVLQPLEQRLGRRIGLLVEPLLNPRPDGFKWVHASAIASWPAGSLAMGRTHFTLAPHRRKTGDETTQLRGGASRFGVGDTNFQLRDHALCFSNFPQQSHRVQCRQRLPELFLALVSGVNYFFRRVDSSVLLPDMARCLMKKCYPSLWKGQVAD